VRIKNTFFSLALAATSRFLPQLGTVILAPAEKAIIGDAIHLIDVFEPKKSPTSRVLLCFRVCYSDRHKG
jgi:hypothetical protein